MAQSRAGHGATHARGSDRCFIEPMLVRPSGLKFAKQGKPGRLRRLQRPFSVDFPFHSGNTD